MNDWYDTNELTLDRETVQDLIDQASPGPARLCRMDSDELREDVRFLRAEVERLRQIVASMSSVEAERSEAGQRP